MWVLKETGKGDVSGPAVLPNPTLTHNKKIYGQYLLKLHRKCCMTNITSTVYYKRGILYIHYIYIYIYIYIY